MRGRAGRFRPVCRGVNAEALTLVAQSELLGAPISACHSRYSAALGKAVGDGVDVVPTLAAAFLSRRNSLRRNA